MPLGPCFDILARQAVLRIIRHGFLRAVGSRHSSVLGTQSQGGIRRLKRRASSFAPHEHSSRESRRSLTSLVTTSLVTQRDENVAAVQSYSIIRYAGATFYRGVLASCDVFMIAKARKTFGPSPISLRMP